MDHEFNVSEAIPIAAREYFLITSLASLFSLHKPFALARAMFSEE